MSITNTTNIDADRSAPPLARRPNRVVQSFWFAFATPLITLATFMAGTTALGTVTLHGAGGRPSRGCGLPRGCERGYCLAQRWYELH